MMRHPGVIAAAILGILIPKAAHAAVATMPTPYLGIMLSLPETILAGVIIPTLVWMFIPKHRSRTAFAIVAISICLALEIFGLSILKSTKDMRPSGALGHTLLTSLVLLGGALTYLCFRLVPLLRRDRPLLMIACVLLFLTLATSVTGNYTPGSCGGTCEFGRAQRIWAEQQRQIVANPNNYEEPRTIQLYVAKRNGNPLVTLDMGQGFERSIQIEVVDRAFLSSLPTYSHIVADVSFGNYLVAKNSITGTAIRVNSILSATPCRPMPSGSLQCSGPNRDYAAPDYEVSCINLARIARHSVEEARFGEMMTAGHCSVPWIDPKAMIRLNDEITELSESKPMDPTKQQSAIEMMPQAKCAIDRTRSIARYARIPFTLRISEDDLVTANQMRWAAGKDCRQTQLP